MQNNKYMSFKNANAWGIFNNNNKFNFNWILLKVVTIITQAVAPAATLLSLEHFEKNPTMYRKGTSIRQAPVFRHLRAFGKAHGSLLSGWMNYNYTACCWFPTSSNILILPDHSSDKSALKVTDCIVQSAEYWCSYDTHFTLWTKCLV